MAVDWPTTGILRAKFGGPIVGATMIEFKRAALEGAQHIGVACGDFRSAAIALTVADLDALASGDFERVAYACPTALIVRPDCLEVFAAHSARQALRGITRRAFVDPDHALSWVQSIVGQKAQAARARRGSSAPRRSTP